MMIHKLPVFNRLRQIENKMKHFSADSSYIPIVPFVFGISLAFALVLCFSTAPAFAADVTLAWNPNTEEDLAGYRIYYGTASGDYDYTMEVGNQTEYTVTGLEEGLLYYFAATAYDLSGNESGYSNEVAYAPPCSYSITPTSQSFDYSGGTGVVNVTDRTCLFMDRRFECVLAPHHVKQQAVQGMERSITLSLRIQKPLPEPAR